MIYLCYELMIQQERDPIERVRKLILAHDFATAQELKVLFGLLRLPTIMFSKKKDYKPSQNVFLVDIEKKCITKAHGFEHTLLGR